MTADDDTAGTGIDTSVPHSARIWNYFLAGKDNYPADRVAGDQFIATFPAIVDIARAGRLFLGRVVTYLARDVGIRQFLDVGTGLPTADNTHQVAQRVAPNARVVYVDNDPLVLAHARALMTSTTKGATQYIHADMHEPDTLLAEARGILDFSQPVAVLFMGVLGHVPELANARRVVRALMDAVPSGSYLALQDGTAVIDNASQDAVDDYNETGAMPYLLRTPEEIKSFFDGLEFVPPGFVSTPLWRPDIGASDDVPRIGRPDEEIDQFGGVGRKP